MRNLGNAISVRSLLAAETAKQHQALHNHPLLSRLLSGGLTAQEYFACVTAHYWLLHSIETARCRMDAYNTFALAPQLLALSKDLAAEDITGRSVEPLHLSTRQEILGALYVAHGAQFGRSVIRSALRTQLPSLPHAYFTLPPDTPLWKTFLKELEATQHHHVPDVLNGAIQAFDLMLIEVGRTQHILNHAHSA